MTAERVYLYDSTLRDGAQTQGVDFSVADKAAIARALDGIGIDYVEGGWPGANPTDDSFFADPPPLHRAQLSAFGMTRRAGRSTSNDPGLAGAAFGQGAGDLHGRQVVGLPGRDRARHRARREPGDDRRQRPLRPRARPRDDVRRRALLRRLQGQPRLRAGLRARRLRGRRPLDRAVRHQRRQPAARGRGDRGGRRQPHPGRQPRHPLPQRHRQRHRQQPGRGARRRPPGAGHAERPRRALRQRRPHRHRPVAGAEDGLFDRAHAHRPDAAHPPLAPARRAAEPRAPAQRPLRRRERLRPQGRPARLGDREGPALLRAHRPGAGRQPPPHRRLRPGRPVQHPRPLPRHRPRHRRPRPEAGAAGRDGEGPRVRRLCLRRRRGELRAARPPGHRRGAGILQAATASGSSTSAAGTPAAS